MGELEPMKMQLIMIATLVAASAYAHDFKSCGTDNLAVASVDVSPDNPIPGANLTVTFTGTPTQDVIVGDTLTITVKVFGVALGHVDFDFCKDLGVTCPIKAGTVSKWNAVYLVPKAAPAGVPLTAEFTAKSSAGAQYSCVDVAVTMGKPPSATPAFLVEAIAAPSCYHHNDVDHNKCYEACGEGAFVVPKLEAKGACGDEYTETDSSSNVNQCEILQGRRQACGCPDCQDQRYGWCLFPRHSEQQVLRGLCHIDVQNDWSHRRRTLPVIV